MLFNSFIFPTVIPYVVGELHFRELSVGSVLVFLFYILTRAAVLIVSRYIPLSYNNYDEKMIDSISLFDGNVLVDRYESISIFVKVILLLAVIVLLILLILPIMAGGSVFTARVITRFSELEKEEAERKLLYEQKRNLMLSDIAHDLRTPITTIYGYSRAILDGKADKNLTDEYLGLICKKSENVVELINLLFDYVKMDSIGFALHRESIDLSELVRQAGALLYQDFIDAGMELVPDIPEEEIRTKADRVQLSRAINNLLTNAIKHNPAGTRIGLILKEQPGGWRLCVADNGPVIGEEISGDLFEPFKTGDESRKSGGGSGLGLSITHKIATLHGYGLRLCQGNDLPSDIEKEGYTKCFLITNSKI